MKPTAVAAPILGVMSGLAFFLGFGTFASASNAIHQIIGLVTILISAVLLVGAVLSFGLVRIRGEVQAMVRAGDRHLPAVDAESATRAAAEPGPGNLERPGQAPTPPPRWGP